MVTMNPPLTNCQKVTRTPCFLAPSTTMTFAAAPSMVAFPARVELEAKVNHILSLFRSATKGERRMTAGTLLMRFDNKAVNTVRPDTVAIPPSLTELKPSSISCSTPDVSKPLSRTNSPMKKRSKVQSTFFDHDDIASALVQER